VTENSSGICNAAGGRQTGGARCTLGRHGSGVHAGTPAPHEERFLIYFWGACWDARTSLRRFELFFGMNWDELRQSRLQSELVPWFGRKPSSQAHLTREADGDARQTEPHHAVAPAAIITCTGIPSGGPSGRRGFVYAFAHVRGGGELGAYWSEDGKLLKKKNTFTDFIACARFLLEVGHSAAPAPPPPGPRAPLTAPVRR
jgi:Prolyl oligopeptidase family